MSRTKRAGRLRRIVACGGALLATVFVVQAVGMVAAQANAANPQPTTMGTATVNANGTVTANLTGTWTWPGQACSGRYGEDWAVDWWGVSSSQTPNPNFSLTNATEVPAAGQTAVGTISAVGSIQIPHTSTYFHVPTYYSGEVVNSSSTCTDAGSGGAVVSSGAWSASATYPSASDIPAQVCVILYDPHGSEGKPSGSANDYSTTHDNDNSIQTNAFNPASGSGYCVSLTFQQTVQGEIYKCIGGSPTTNLVNGGTIAVPSAGLSSSNPLAATQVAAGSYAVNATAPSGQQFVACGQNGVTINGGSATQTVTVPSGGSGDGRFYVVPLTQTIQSEIYACVNGSPTTTLVSGGTIDVPSSGLSSANPLGATQVAAGSYAVNANAPSGDKFVACGQSGVTINGGSASQTVTVPSGGSGDGVFYVVPIPATQTIQSEIYACVNGQPTTTLISGGTIAVPAAGLSGGNPLAATQVAAGSYAVNATAPSDMSFVDCGQGGVTNNGGTATQTVTVPTGGSGDAKFYTQPSGSGFIEICKSSANGVAGNFTFSFNGTSVTVPAGQCSQAMAVPAGQLKVTEASSPTYKTTGATTTPSSRLVSFTKSTRTAVVTIVNGGVQAQTILTFTNAPKSGTVKICEVGPAGTTYSFTNSATSQTVSVQAGFCVVLNGTFSGTLTLTQAPASGSSVSSIMVTPKNRLVSTDLTHGKITIQVGGQVNEVTFTNVLS